MNNSFIADLIVVIHLAYVIMVVGGLFVILIGGFLKWRFVRIFWLRAVHLAMILIVVLEALLGIVCPLTDWEYDIRTAAGQHDVSNMSFIARLVHYLIFFEFPEYVFTIGYCLFAIAVIISWRLFPPRIPWKKEKKEQVP